MTIDNVLDLFFSLCGGTDLFYFATALVALSGIISVLVRRFQNV